MIWFSLLVFLLTPSAQAATPTLFTHMSPESERDPRVTYDRELLRLALEKTRASHGDFQLRAAPPMTLARMWISLRFNHYPNLFAMDSYRSDRDMTGVDYVRFPIHLGIVSYRICFVSPQQQAAVASVTTLDQLKKLTLGQGKGWLDVHILRLAGFKVQEVEGYELLFKMVARGRFDLFCRGISELPQEKLNHKEITDLVMDESIALYYPLPRVFFAHNANREAIQRVEAGLKAAWQDGSLQTLWLNTFKPSLTFARLDTRRLFRLENPFIKGIGFNYQAYFYDPVHSRFGPGEP
ncbi:hypothetical protein OB934_13235 [Aeromonas salmonicida]|uniref:hypothetical protein n=1 Tax=Aeromonas salmonicida TaxID=645 RepID=UPI00259F9294|nr:hypothetical protein [Aeromonas salmonicida]MDM5063757.1 hypothetical protein [Aeromonas salmonicida]